MSDRLRIQIFLRRAWRRRAALSTLLGAAVAVLGALVLMGAGRLGWLPWRFALAGGLAVILVGGVTGWWRARRLRPRIAHDVERRAPRCRNLLITAAELAAAEPVAAEAAVGDRGSTQRPGAPPVRPEIVRLVEAHAANLVRELDAATLFPLRRAVAVLVACVAVWGALAAVAGAVPGVGAAGGTRGERPADTRAAAPDAAPAIAAVEVTVTPPAYTGRSARTLPDPARLEVVAGARLALRVHAAAETVLLSTLQGERVVERQDDGTFGAELVAEADGFLSVEPRAGGRRGARRLIGLLVAPDVPPRVRIDEPGRDLFLPRPEGEVPIVATASDDFGLADLRLTYTIVSGSGETFEFTEGELPAAVTRDGELSWSARTVLTPADLGLSLGDMVVYRAVARDRRPGAAEVQSDAFVLEIVGENAAISGGFALESDEEREALSQRMVIIKTERLLARRGALSADEYGAEARRIAAEQRLVRAEFVFMMGGEVQDEFEEAEHEHEVAAGRLELRGRLEMTRAVQLMSQAATRLTEADLDAALPLENAALEALQSALARSRYILRTMAERESIDLGRRLSGDPGAPRGVRAAEQTVADPRIAGLRRIVAQLAAMSGAAATAGDLGAPDARRLDGLAEELLRLDPSSVELQQIAAELTGAAAGVEAGVARLDRAIASLVGRLDELLPRAPAAPEADPDLAGALSDELARNVPSGGRR